MSVKNDHQRRHKRISKQARIAAAIEDTMLRAARDLGREHYTTNPDAQLATVAQFGAKMLGDNKNQQIAFLQGYIEARTQHDAFKRGE